MLPEAAPKLPGFEELIAPVSGSGRPLHTRRPLPTTSVREFSRDKKVAAVAFDRAARLGSVTPRRLQNEQKVAPFPLCSLSLSSPGS